jgi:type IV pilus assembly protein PilE
MRALLGVTLIELLTVMAVVAILATIAAVSYRRYVVRTYRTDATTMLLRVQVAQEKYFLQNNTYANDVTAQLGFASDTTQEGSYKLSLAAASGADYTTSYVATATAQGPQASSDPDCQQFTINDRGQRGSSPGDASLCWH